MLRRLLFLIVVMAVMFFCLAGCKKSSNEGESAEPPAKTMADYEAEAKEEVTEDNMADELQKITQDVEEEVSQDP